MRRAQYGNPDRNQGAIVQALRFAGCSVAITSGVGGGFPDLVVGRRGVNTLLEVKPEKDPDKRKMRLSEREKEWHDAWLGTVYVVRSPLEALCAVGVPVRQAESLARVAALGELPTSVMACSEAPPVVMDPPSPWRAQECTEPHPSPVYEGLNRLAREDARKRVDVLRKADEIARRAEDKIAAPERGGKP